MHGYQCCDNNREDAVCYRTCEPSKQQCSCRVSEHAFDHGHGSRSNSPMQTELVSVHFPMHCTGTDTVVVRIPAVVVVVVEPDTRTDLLVVALDGADNQMKNFQQQTAAKALSEPPVSASARSNPALSIAAVAAYLD